jgi:hypothetical protein
MLDTILHDRIRELEGKLRHTTPATKADIDELHERLGKIEASLDALCRGLLPGSPGQRGWRLRRDNDHQARRNIAA